MSIFSSINEYLESRLGPPVPGSRAASRFFTKARPVKQKDAYKPAPKPQHAPKPQYVTPATKPVQKPYQPPQTYSDDGTRHAEEYEYETWVDEQVDVWQREENRDLFTLKLQDLNPSMSLNRIDIAFENLLHDVRAAALLVVGASRPHPIDYDKAYDFHQTWAPHTFTNYQNYLI